MSPGGIDRTVEEMLATRLDDFREFARHIDTHLES